MDSSGGLDNLVCVPIMVMLEKHHMVGMDLDDSKFTYEFHEYTYNHRYWSHRWTKIVEASFGIDTVPLNINPNPICQVLPKKDEI